MKKTNISNSDLQLLGIFSIFQGLNTNAIDQLLLGSLVMTFNHRESAINHGEKTDCFCIVLKGAFKLVRHTINGNDVIMYFATPGDSIGALLMNKPLSEYPLSAIAMGESTIVRIPRSTYETYWANNVEIQKRLNNIIYSRMSVLQDDKILSKAPLGQKIAHLLINLLERSPQKDGQMISIPLTRQEIADSLGVTVEAVIRTMSDWSQSGVIITQDKKIEILKMDKILEFIKG